MPSPVPPVGGESKMRRLRGAEGLQKAASMGARAIDQAADAVAAAESKIDNDTVHGSDPTSNRMAEVEEPRPRRTSIPSYMQPTVSSASKQRPVPGQESRKKRASPQQLPSRTSGKPTKVGDAEAPKKIEAAAVGTPPPPPPITPTNEAPTYENHSEKEKLNYSRTKENGWDHGMQGRGKYRKGRRLREMICCVTPPSVDED